MRKLQKRKKKKLASFIRSLTCQDKCDNQAVERKSLCENEDKNHDDEELGLLSGGADTSITDDTDAKAGGETGEAV